MQQKNHFGFPKESLSEKFLKVQSEKCKEQFRKAKIIICSIQRLHLFLRVCERHNTSLYHAKTVCHNEVKKFSICPLYFLSTPRKVLQMQQTLYQYLPTEEKKLLINESQS